MSGVIILVMVIIVARVIASAGRAGDEALRWTTVRFMTLPMATKPFSYANRRRLETYPPQMSRA